MIFMAKKLILGISLILITINISLSQVKSKFSGEISKFKEELTVYLGPNLNPDQTGIENSFKIKWDSSGFGKDNMVKIINIASLLAQRNMRPSPHFIDYLKTLTEFCDYKKSPDFFNYWLTGMSKLVLNTRLSNDYIDRYFRNTISMINDNIFFDSGNIKWKIKSDNIKFGFDTTFKIIVTDVTLTCFSQKDSTEIYKVTGVYYPETIEFHGSQGIITWEKAGYNKEDVFAEINNYVINNTKNSFTIDSAKLTHKTYFTQPVYGKLTDQASSYSNKERAVFPRFETYTKKFKIENLYKGVNYEGGLALEGASVKGTGENYNPAVISLFRNDTLYVNVKAKSFLLSKTGINSMETSAVLYLDKDSIFHSSLSFSYNADSRQVNLFRSNNPVSKSPYYDSFHGLDMYFEYLSWNMNDSKIILSRARGASIGQAKFESLHFLIQTILRDWRE